MKKILTALALVSALAFVSACADDYYGDRGHYGDGYGRGYYGGAAPAYAYYDGYYDGYYGPLYSGYWGPDSFFYYSTGPDRAFVRDDGKHFRRDQFAGYEHFHVRDMHNRG